MDRSSPPDDAYGRVSDPERFRPLHAAADHLVRELVAVHDVDAIPADPEAVREAARVEVLRAVELVPADAAAARVTIVHTAFPGLVVEAGAWHVASFPTCGCDACSERTDELERDLRELLDAVTAGRFTESLVGRWYEVEIASPSGSSRSRERLARGEARRRGRFGRRTWAPWPRRA